MERGKRSTISKIGRDTADHDFNSASASQLEKIGEILFKIPVSNIHRRIGAAYLVFEKHLHAAPFLFMERGWSKPGNEPLESLAATSCLQLQRRANPGQARRPLAEDSPRPERTDNFVVAHVQDP